jgi:hypothetical protein
MKVLKEKQVIEEEIQDTEDEGLISLLGKTVTFFCAVYIYTGKLVGVNKTCVKLESPKIVYETGPFEEKKWKDAQPLPHDFYIQLSMVEGFGVIK